MPPENTKVEFDSEKIDEQKRRKILYSRIEPSSVEPRLIKFLIAKRIIRNEHQGDILLVLLFVACVVASVLLFEYSSKTSGVNLTTDAVVKALQRQ